MVNTSYFDSNYSYSLLLSSSFIVESKLPRIIFNCFKLSGDSSSINAKKSLSTRLFARLRSKLFWISEQYEMNDIIFRLFRILLTRLRLPNIETVLKIISTTLSYITIQLRTKNDINHHFFLFLDLFYQKLIKKRFA